MIADRIEFPPYLVMWHLLLKLEHKKVFLLKVLLVFAFIPHWTKISTYPTMPAVKGGKI